MSHLVAVEGVLRRHSPVRECYRGGRFREEIVDRHGYRYVSPPAAVGALLLREVLDNEALEVGTFEAVGAGELPSDVGVPEFIQLYLTLLPIPHGH